MNFTSFFFFKLDHNGDEDEEFKFCIGDNAVHERKKKKITSKNFRCGNQEVCGDIRQKSNNDDNLNLKIRLIQKV